jgi:signal transduction histidine kinase
VRRLGEQLEVADEPADALPGVAHALQETLGASGVRIEPDPVVALEPAAAGNELHEPWLERTVSHRGLQLGRLIIGARVPGERFGPADVALAEILVRQLALVLDALRMAAEVQHSREAIVTAREEERRRLRGDLHDGLGPTLAGAVLTIDAARRVLVTDPEAADALLDRAADSVEGTVTDVRRLVYGLRPPALDQLGLTGALRQHATTLTLADTQLTCEIAAPDALPPLPAAVEAAAFRIAQEALTNVARHAQAHHAVVAIAIVGDALGLDIADDGRGLPRDRHAGVGLTSMRERATELGGSFELAAAAGGGTLVRVSIPLPG